MQSPEKFWVIPKPPNWPQAPDRFSFSSTKEIEQCPLRWSLLNADFSKLWKGDGYPSRPSKGALKGLVLHFALEDITRALIANACTSIKHASFISTMRSLGGYSKVICDAIDKATEPLHENPRFLKVKEHLLLELGKEHQSFIKFIKDSLAEIKLSSVPARSGEGKSKTAGKALGIGAYPEVWLAPQTLNWRGKADLISISADDVEILDFKTGDPEEEHLSQLHLYNLLWWRDSAKNPAARLPSKLTVVYKEGKRSFPGLTKEEILKFEGELLEKEQNALTLLKEQPPKSNPSKETCKFCSMKHLCDDYWRSLIKTDSPAVGNVALFKDVQVKVIKQESSKSWLVEVEASDFLDKGTQMYIRSDFNDLLTEKVMNDSKSIRILSGIMNTAVDQSEELESIKISKITEVYRLL